MRDNSKIDGCKDGQHEWVNNWTAGGDEYFCHKCHARKVIVKKFKPYREESDDNVSS